MAGTLDEQISQIEFSCFYNSTAVRLRTLKAQTNAVGRRDVRNMKTLVDSILIGFHSPPFPRLPTHGHDRPYRRDVGRVFLAGVRPDSPSRRRIPSCCCPGPGRGATVEMGQRSVHQPHTTPVNSVHVSAPCADMFGDSVCAREADDTAAESWYVPLFEGVHPVCRLDSATGWRSGCRRAGGLVEPFVREKIQDWNRSA